MDRNLQQQQVSFASADLYCNDLPPVQSNIVSLPTATSMGTPNPSYIHLQRHATATSIGTPNSSYTQLQPHATATSMGTPNPSYTHPQPHATATSIGTPNSSYTQLQPHATATSMGTPNLSYTHLQPYATATSIGTPNSSYTHLQPHATTTSMGTPNSSYTPLQPHATATSIGTPNTSYTQMQPHASTDNIKLPNTTHTHATPSTVLSSHTNRHQILLSTAIIQIQDASGKWINARALLDAGSEVNIATHRLASMLQLACKGDICNISGIGNTQKQSQMSIHTSISSRYTNYKADLTFIVLDNIAVPLPHNYIPTHTWHIPTKQAHTLADPTFFIPSSIDLLIGAELFYSILLTGRIKLGSCLPFLIETTLGWVVSGSYIPDSSELTSDCTTPVSMHLSPTPTDGILQSFREQEEVLSTQKLISPDDKYCEELYTSTTTQNNDDIISTAQVVNICSTTGINYSFFYEHFKRFSSYTNLSRSISYLFRFIHNLKNKHNKLTSHLSVSELKHSQTFILQATQHHSFHKEIQEFIYLFIYLLRN
ncbi:uncharacterized protein LOC126381284 [Pectinophora gossypiella]|uniref:uncharacterized protein LOC126381284 n=1 Tax=Pectinophora gossypiella TaxID=13191 RepID=UPI00214E8061|nr:uncharacterized protein LOC126381284 [Pectinophora gossypiella]